MRILPRLRIRSKLLLLMMLSVLAVVVCTAAGASITQRRMLDSRVDKLSAMIDSVSSYTLALTARMQAGELTRDQVLEKVRDLAHTTRFDNGDGYFSLQTVQGLVLAHGARPDLENKLGQGRAADGRSVAQLAIEALQGQDRGVIWYDYPKPGQQKPQPKVGVVGRIPALDAFYTVGAYVDDLDAEFYALVRRLAEIGGGILLVTVGLAWMINRDIGGSLGRLRASMGRLAEGDLAVEIPGTDRGDEVGGMANAVLVFKDHMEQARSLAAAQAAERAQAEAAKQAAMVKMADTIEQETAAALETVKQRTDSMAETARGMSDSAACTEAAAEAAAAAAGTAMANIQTVASAAEQLTASIREIGTQMAHSKEMTSRAVSAGNQTRDTIEALNERVGRIGTVADMIAEIAARTNLLALNATIEAARAGEAGKGFAVVASEVKALASQTARSTEEIGRHISEVRAATGASVDAVGRIEATITEIDSIASSIAAAVEQQGAATAEIARTVADTALAANEMNTRSEEVQTEAARTDKFATSVRDDTAGLSGAVGDLKHAVIRVVRTSTAEVNRRRDVRHPVDRPCRVATAGNSSISGRLGDISRSGAKLLGMPEMAVGSRGELHLEGVPFALPFTVRASGAGSTNVEFQPGMANAAEWERLCERYAPHQAA